MKVKICGITNKDDATWAINYGADFLGINFYSKSSRHCTVASASTWATTLPPFVPLVGVFVDATEKDVLNAIVKLNLKGIQLHGDETPEFIAGLRKTLASMGRTVFIMKAFRMKDESTLGALSAYAPHVDYILLDSFVDGVEGGTGTRFNWDLAVMTKEAGKPIFLAGGLSPENVKDAIKKVAPFAVDVASGVEKSPRKKDQKKMQDFIRSAKG